jgi:hypothetical protein
MLNSLFRRPEQVMNLIWIIRALRKINQEIPESVFPSFLDRESIQYMLKSADTQEELDHYCKKNGMHGYATDFEEFRYLDSLDNNKEKIEETNPDFH